MRTVQPASDPIRVLLVEDHTLVRQGLRKILESDPQIEIAGEIGDGLRAVELALQLRPTVTVMDIGLPGLNGIEATRRITASLHWQRVLMLSMHADRAYVHQSVKAGAKGYLLKDSEDLDLIKAVRSLAGGGSYFSPRVSSILLAGYVSRLDRPAAGVSRQ